MMFGSLFSGVGGFDLGLERAGMECAWTVEYDKQARSVLRKQWPDVPHYEDVHNVGCVRVEDGGEGGINADNCNVSDVGDQFRMGTEGGSCTDTREPNGAYTNELTPVDLICGGFPCQDYSVAGKRGGLVGDRGALWWQMHRIIAQCRPTWVVGENVPGLMSSNGGRDFLTIIASLVELGYGVTWATLDSQYFGVAQRRRRLFIVGHLGGIARPEILALSEGLRWHPAPIRDAGKIAPTLFASGAGTERTAACGSEADFVVMSSGQTNQVTGVDTYNSTLSGNVSIPVRASAGQRPIDASCVMTHTAQPVAFNTTQVTHPANRSNPQPGDPCDTLASGDHAPLIAHENISGYTTEADHARALRAGASASYQFLTTATPRRLTPTECERLQGFPDGWTSGGITDEGDHKQLADGPRYRMMGNAVTVNVAEWIGDRIMGATV